MTALGLSAVAFASEVDSVTTRTATRVNARPFLNQLARGWLRDVARLASEGSHGQCRASDLRAAARERFSGYLVIGQAEARILLDPLSPTQPETFRTSIFRNFPFFEFPQLWTVAPTLARLLRFDGHFIGTDKIGHFFDEGLTYYDHIDRSGMSLEQALDWGIGTERGHFGLDMNGIFSWGDLVANYQGLRFWKELVDRYFRCERGEWSIHREFDFSRYIDAGWDEGINCPEFRTPTLEAGVQREIRIRERARGGERLTCPIRPEECTALVRKYGLLSGRLLSPLCRAEAASSPTL